MKIDPAINQTLNTVLKDVLTLVNQTFLHARMLNNWGLKRIGGQTYKNSIDLMKQADRLIKRILFLEGLPNLQALGSLMVGEDALEILSCDHKGMLAYREKIQGSMELCESKQDYQSREHLEGLLEEAEEAIDFYETQESLIRDLGIENYLQSQVIKED